MFENPRRGRQARNFTTNVPKILVLKSSSEQIFSENWRWVFLNFLETFLHSLSTPLFSLKCVPLLPQCWAMRILEHWEDCNTQINFGEGENNAQKCFKIFGKYCSSVSIEKKCLKTVSSCNPPQVDFPFSQVSNFLVYLTDGQRSSQVIF